MLHLAVVDSSGVLIACEPKMKDIEMSLLSNLLVALRMFSKEIFGKPMMLTTMGDLKILMKDICNGDALVALISTVKDEYLLERAAISIEQVLNKLRDTGVWKIGLITEKVSKPVRKTLVEILRDVPPYTLLDELYELIKYVPLPFSDIPKKLINEKENEQRKWISRIDKAIKKKKISIRNLTKAVESLAKREIINAFKYACKSGDKIAITRTYLLLGWVRGFNPKEVINLIKDMEECYQKYLEFTYHCYFGELDFRPDVKQFVTVREEISKRVRNMSTLEELEAALFSLPPGIERKIPAVIEKFITDYEKRFIEKYRLIYKEYAELRKSSEEYSKRLREIFSNFLILLDYTPKTKEERKVHAMIYVHALLMFSMILDSFHPPINLIKKYAEYLLSKWKTLDRSMIGNWISTTSAIRIPISIYMITLALNEKYDTFFDSLNLVTPIVLPLVAKKAGRSHILDGLLIIEALASIWNRENIRNKLTDAWLSLYPLISREDIIKLFSSKKFREDNVSTGIWIMACNTLTAMHLFNKASLDELVNKAENVFNILRDKLKERGICPYIFEEEFRRFKSLRKI